MNLSRKRLAVGDQAAGDVILHSAGPDGDQLSIGPDDAVWVRR